MRFRNHAGVPTSQPKPLAESMEIDVLVHRDRETHTYWAETPRLPGCFAVGRTRSELNASLEEAVALYLKDAQLPDLLVNDRIFSVDRYRWSPGGGLSAV